jgi:hypothetical protein
MQVRGLENLSREEVVQAMTDGGRFIVFEFCISIIFLTMRRPSAVWFIRPGQWTWPLVVRYSLVSLLLGWWGVPWGLIYTPLTLVTNLSGGVDVSAALWPRTHAELDHLLEIARATE